MYHQKLMVQLILLVVSLSLLFVPCFSLSIYISPFGNDKTGNGSLSYPYQTLSRGVVAATSNGDTVIAMPGNYPVGTVNINNQITITSQKGPSTVIFTNPTINGGVGLNLDGVTFYDSDGIALYFNNFPNPIVNVNNCQFILCSTAISCTGYYDRGTFTINNSNFTNNDLDISVMVESLTITNSNFTNSGGFSVLHSTDFTLINSTLKDTKGIYFADLSTFTVDNCDFYNVSSPAQPAIMSTSNVLASISNSRFTSCHYSDDNNQFNGAAISLGASTLNINQTSFSNNMVGGNGGAIYVTSSYLNILDSTFRNNIAGGNGGAIYMDSQSNLNLMGCDFINNIAESGDGGAFGCDSSSEPVSIFDCTFTNSTEGKCSIL